MVEAVAFDFDGVLVGLETHVEARVEAFMKFASYTGDKRYLVSDAVHQEAHLHGSHPPQIIGWILQKQGLVRPDTDPSEDALTQSVVLLKEQLYIARINSGLDALDGSLACVYWASDRFGSDRTAIVTTASQQEVDPFIEKHDLDELVGVVVTRKDTGKDRLKPDPLAYNLAVKKLGTKPNETVAIEDSVRGLQSAKSAGLIALGITTTHTADQLREAADHIVDSFEDVPSVIGSC